MDYEYGIEWIKPDRREDTPHRTGMTLEEAQAFMTNDDSDPFAWSDIFKIIRRPIGAWQDLPVLGKPGQHGVGCRCTGGITRGLDILIGKDCGSITAASINHTITNVNRCGCGSLAGVNGFCGPTGCINLPG